MTMTHPAEAASTTPTAVEDVTVRAVRLADEWASGDLDADEYFRSVDLLASDAIAQELAEASGRR
ncbi:hypothetical protein [Modestobacter sp. SYSU DS0290]